MDKFWIGLSSVEELGSAFILALYKHFNNIERAFWATQNELYQIEGITKKKADKFLNIRDKLNLEKILSYVTMKIQNTLKCSKKLQIHQQYCM